MIIVRVESPGRSLALLLALLGLALPGPASSSAAAASTGTFVIFYRCDPDARRELFARSSVRVVPIAATDFRVAAVRGTLVRLANASASEIRYVASVAAFGLGSPLALSTPSGHGLLLRAVRRGTGFEVGVCAAKAGAPVRHLATKRLDANSALLVALDLEGESYVAAIRCETLSPATQNSRQREFREGTEASTDELKITRLDVPPGGDACLNAR